MKGWMQNSPLFWMPNGPDLGHFTIQNPDKNRRYSKDKKQDGVQNDARRRL